LQEYGGIIKHGAKLMYAFSEATVPKITLITRKSYGGAYCVMASKHIGADVNFAYPTAEIAVMGSEGAVNILFRDKLRTEEDRLKKIQEYQDTFANPYKAAEMGYIDEIILPRQTRPKLIMALEMTQNKTEIRPPKKHGNIPL
jgi:propionyl-CoA carboxylase beta chain